MVDVFISYAWADNEVAAGEGWVTAFGRRLQIRLKQVGTGPALRVWRDQIDLDRSKPTTSLLEDAERARALLCVVSPPYFGSKWCKDERDAFLGATGGDRPVFLIVKWPSESEDPLLKTHPGYDFSRSVLLGVRQHERAISTVASPDARLVAFAYDGERIKVQDLDREVEPRLLRAGFDVAAMEWIGDELLVEGSREARLFEKGQRIAAVKRAGELVASSAASLPALAAADREGVAWWTDERTVEWHASPDDEVRAIALHPNGKRMAIGLSSGELVIIDATGRTVMQGRLAPIDEVAWAADDVVAMLEDGQVWTVSMDGSHTLFVWRGAHRWHPTREGVSVASGEWTYFFGRTQQRRPTGRSIDAAFDAGTNRLAVIDGEGVIRIYDAPDNKTTLVARRRVPPGDRWRLHFATQGTSQALYAVDPGRLFIFDISPESREAASVVEIAEQRVGLRLGAAGFEPLWKPAIKTPEIATATRATSANDNASEVWVVPINAQETIAQLERAAASLGWETDRAKGALRLRREGKVWELRYGNVLSLAAEGGKLPKAAYLGLAGRQSEAVVALGVPSYRWNERSVMIDLEQAKRMIEEITGELAKQREQTKAPNAPLLLEMLPPSASALKGMHFRAYIKLVGRATLSSGKRLSASIGSRRSASILLDAGQWVLSSGESDYAELLFDAEETLRPGAKFELSDRSSVVARGFIFGAAR